MLVPLLLAAAPPQALHLPTWLVGEWCEQTERARSCETWRAVGSAMTGSSEVVRADGESSGEQMRIGTVRGKTVFTATPDGDPPADFVLVRHGPGEMLFENAANEYPQRIRYWREGALLKAEISMLDGSRRLSWTYRRVK
ncbi:DUF6265 family protein [Sphingomonas sp. M1-B02]|uniref:DUF6265 family protein n=1 Tax=Sphingomonas sp. M1-B02 TaxID=3114300 RepID=UPI00223EAC25|nr:DUF6265 family protein [Sphingomonas sp. S6-11]UZK68006.1 DUF6265 family protein [Sphingomonas sp. S6-11]